MANNTRRTHLVPAMPTFMPGIPTTWCSCSSHAHNVTAAASRAAEEVPWRRRRHLLPQIHEIYDIRHIVNIQYITTLEMALALEYYVVAVAVMS